MDVILYLLSIILGATGAWTVANYAPVLGFLDHPNRRSSHDRPTPKGGGVGILAAFILSSLFLQVPFAFLVPATFLSILSLFGDKREISPKLRLPIQFIAALILIIPVLFSHSSSVLCPLYPVECL